MPGLKISSVSLADTRSWLLIIRQSDSWDLLVVTKTDPNIIRTTVRKIMFTNTTMIARKAVK